MSETKKKLECPHCGDSLKAVDIPVEMAWKNNVHYVCFNNECSYFTESAEWMMNNYASKVIYRYRVVDPDTGEASPLTVWSKTALLDRIIEEAD